MMNNNSNIVYVGKLHWLLFLWPTLFTLVAIYVGITYPAFKEMALMFLVFSLIWWGMMWVIYYFSSLTVEKKRVIFRTGFLVRKTTDIPFNKIESMDVSQSLIGSLLGYGSFSVTGSGGTRYYMNFLSHPLTCRRYIEERMNEEE